MNSVLAPFIGVVIASLMMGFAFGQSLGKEQGKEQLQEIAVQRNVAQYNPKTADFEFKRCPTDTTTILPN